MKGIINIIITDSTTGLIKTDITKTNLITEEFLLRALGRNGGFITDSGFTLTTIGISTRTDPPQFLDTQLEVFATGYIPDGVDSPTWNDSINPPFIQFQNRIDFVEYERTFDSVGLVFRNSANIIDPPLDSTAIAYTLLDTTCVQGAFDFIDIFYRIQFENEGENFSDEVLYQYAQRLIGKGVFNVDQMHTYFGSISQASNYNYLKMVGSNNLIGRKGVFGQQDFTIWDSVQNINNHYKTKYQVKYDLNEQVGLIINTLQHGQSDASKSKNHSWSYLTGKLTNSSEPFQNLFGHSSTATKPFFEPLTTPSGTGKIITSGNPTFYYPQLYKYKILKTGDTGTAKYKFSVRNHLGFEGNTYTDRTLTNIYRYPIEPPSSLMHGYRYENNDPHVWSSTQIVQYDQTGVTLLDVVSGEYTNWEVDTIPSLPVTQLRQVAVDPTNELIYCGCRSTGLWIIDVANETVTQQLNSPCYGVDVGRNDVAYTIIAGGLYSSDNWASPLSLTLSNWADVYFLKADPEHIDDRLAIVSNGVSQRQVLWWDKTNGLSSGVENNTYVQPYPASLDFSPEGNYCVSISDSLLTYGTTTRTYFNSQTNSHQRTHSVYGEIFLGKVAFYNNYLIGNDRLTDLSDLSVVVSYSNWQNFGFGDSEETTFLIHLDGGIALTPTRMRQLFTDNIFCWVDYGWDGSSWTSDNTAWVDGGEGGRLTHTAVEPLINGIELKFEDVQNPNWIAGDYYTQSINDGLLKDNATTVDLRFAWYSAPVVFSAAASGTIPASAPYILELPAVNEPTFIRIETDSPELHQFEIDGQPVATVYVDGEAPGINEVTIDGETGILTFNSADTGKSFEAVKYAYVTLSAPSGR
ncbi:MAG: hypothetical protein WBF90_33585 [Rivularia sp. (in: cyanobacteria)]